MPEEVEAAVELAVVDAAVKLVVNHAYENMGLASTQTLGPILDGLMRNTPDAKRFIELAEEQGVPAAVRERDALFGDQAAPEDKPDPGKRDRALGVSEFANILPLWQPRSFSKRFCVLADSARRSWQGERGSPARSSTSIYGGIESPVPRRCGGLRPLEGSTSD